MTSLPIGAIIGFARLNWRTILPLGALLVVSLWAWRIDSLRAHYKHQVAAERIAHDKTIADFSSAQKVARALAEANLKAVEAQYRSIANEADKRYNEGLVKGRSMADAYIAANRVRNPAGQCSAGQAGAAAQSGGAQVPAPVPAEADLVTATAKDVQACAAAVKYADEAHKWAIKIERSFDDRQN